MSVFDLRTWTIDTEALWVEKMVPQADEIVYWLVRKQRFLNE
jgi:hypothetical protein